MASEDVVLTVRRTGNVVTHVTSDGTKETGEVSDLEVSGLADKYYALERRGGYVTLPAGNYVIQMETSPTHAGRKQFRVMDHNVYSAQHKRKAAILIHSGNYPGHVTGCIAPGKKKIKLKSSKKKHPF